MTTRSRNAGCLDEAALAALATSAGTAEERDLQIRHIADCSECREHLAALLVLLDDPAVRSEMVRLERRWAPGLRRTLLIGAGLAAAAAVAILVVPSRRSPDIASGHRGPTITAAAAPRVVAPVGDVSNASALTWSRIEGAERYRVTLFSASGSRMFEMELADTTVTLPDSVTLTPGVSYLWKVDVNTGYDRWASSDLVEFRVVIRPGRPLSMMPAAFINRPVQEVHDSLRLLAPHLSDSALVVEIRARPGDVREALSGTLALAVHGGPAPLALAHRLADAYAKAFSDSFLLRQVARFTAWPIDARATKVRADSLRKIGVAIYGRDGIAAATTIWRRALAGAQAIDDSAGMAATLGNIGAAFLGDNRPDSARVYLDRARALAAAVGDRHVEANALDELAGVCEASSDIAGARRAYAAAIALHGHIGDSRGLAADYNNLAGLARATGDFEEARRQLTAALAINRRDGRVDLVATNLVNLAALAALTGDFAHGEALYREALATWRARQQWADLADGLRGVGELEIRRGNYPAARADLLEAMTLYDRTGPANSAVVVRQQLAMIRAAEGELQGALDELRHAQQLADSMHVSSAVTARIALARADLAVELNTFGAAESSYLAAADLARRAADRATEAEAQQGLAILLLDRHDLNRAGALLAAAFRTDSALGDVRAAALARVMQGECALRAGDTTRARRLFSRATSELRQSGDPVAAAAAEGEQAALEVTARMPATADVLYRDAIARVGSRVAPGITWRLHAGLGTVRRTLGDLAGARQELRAAIADIEHASGTLALPERRSTFQEDKWDVYAELAMLERDGGDPDAAFAVSETIRAREMLELLTEGRVAAPADTAASLVAREQDLRRYIAELTRQLEGPVAGTQLLRGPDVSQGTEVTRETLLHAQQSYNDLLLDIQERAPRHADLVAPATAAWRDVARRLRGGEAFIEYLMSDAGAIAFVVTPDTLVAVPLPVSRRDVAGLVDVVRGTLQPRGTPRLDSLWRAPLRQLDHDLIAPIEATGLLRNTTRLTIVPHAELHYLPFAALLGGVGQSFLIERYEITVTPSASVWLALGARPLVRATGGVLALAPQPDALPGSREEVNDIARLSGPGTRLLIGSAATEAALRRDAPTSRVIHLATYGVLNKQNPLFSFVELAPGTGDDGRLEAHEVFGLRLVADLVVLSACQTALGSGAITDVPAGDDWIGLARAFLSAGAARVMAALWPVQDRATATLMEQFYERFTRGDNPATALAAAQRALIANPATAAPYYWAGFELVGGP